MLDDETWETVVSCLTELVIWDIAAEFVILSADTSSKYGKKKSLETRNDKIPSTNK